MKLSELKKQIEEAIVEILNEASGETTKQKLDKILKPNSPESAQFKKDVNDNKPDKIAATLNKAGIEEAEDDDDSSTEKEPTKSELKKNAGVAKIKDELAKVTKKMKDLAKEYSKAEGDKKTKIKDQLKSLTAEKKDLEKRLDKSL
jgi:hypothetical protein